MEDINGDLGENMVRGSMIAIIWVNNQIFQSVITRKKKRNISHIKNLIFSMYMPMHSIQVTIYLTWIRAIMDPTTSTKTSTNIAMVIRKISIYIMCPILTLIMWIIILDAITVAEAKNQLKIQSIQWMDMDHVNQLIHFDLCVPYFFDPYPSSNGSQSNNYTNASDNVSITLITPYIENIYATTIM
jgi:hypothetical protein